jgi:Protein of unknown function DUF58
MKKFLYPIFYFIYALNESRKRRLTNYGLILLICLIISAFLGLDTTQSMTYQIFSFLLSLLIISIVFSKIFPVRFLNAVRILPRFATAGIKLKYPMVIENKTNKIQTELKLLEHFADRRPTLSEFLQTPEPDENKRNSFDQYLGYYRWLWLINRKQNAITKPINLPPLPPHSKTEVQLEITPTYRGIIHLNHIIITRADPFNLFNAYQKIFRPQEILILPKLYNIPPIQLPGSRKYQSGGVALSSSVGDSQEFKGLRDYRPGDSLKKIAWKSLAKLGKPLVKEEQDEFFVRHALILDTFQNQQYSEVLEEAISVAASFAYEVQTQESLLDLMFVGNESYCFTFGRSISHTEKMLEILASVVACKDKSFDSMIPLIMERISLLSGCICIFIAWDEQRKKLVDYLRGIGVNILVLIIVDNQANSDKINAQLSNDKNSQFHILKLGKIQEGLMNI